MRFSFGYDLTDTVRQAILQSPEDAWVPALDQDGTARENGDVAEITDLLDLSSWPQGCRVIDRIASEPGLLDALRVAHGRARERFWGLHGAPESVTIDIDATLITAHSD